MGLDLSLVFVSFFLLVQSVRLFFGRVKLSQEMELNISFQEFLDTSPFICVFRSFLVVDKQWRHEFFLIIRRILFCRSKE